MRICQTKRWSIDDWELLSDTAQEYELAWHEYQYEKYKAYLDMLEEKLPRNDEGKINTPEAYYMLLLKRLDLL